MRGVLTTRLLLMECKAPASLFEEPKAEKAVPGDWQRRFMLRTAKGPLRFRVADQFDLEADGLVLDARLGTLGVVHVLAGDDGRVVAADDLSKRVAKWIDQSTHVRHLLLEGLRPGEPQGSAAPYTVEIVFVLPPAGTTLGITRTHQSVMRQQIGSVLRELLRETTFLDAVGINLWSPADRDGLADTSAVRRAFAWLLPDVKFWFQDQAKQASPAQKTHSASVTQLAVSHFRLPGTRAWRLEPNLGLHVVHGHNGSGKSSLVEALEFAITGKIQRLTEQTTRPNYRKIITNRHAENAGRTAEVTLSFERGKAHVCKVLEYCGHNPLYRGRSAAFFRMTQSLGNQLAEGTPEERAQIFVEAFFPQQRAPLRRINAATDRKDRALARLPARIHRLFPGTGGKFSPKRALASLAWVKKKQFPWENVWRLLPLTPADLESIRPLLAAHARDYLGRKGQARWSDALSAAAAIDGELATLAGKAETLARTLAEVNEFFSEYAGATARPVAQTRQRFARLLDEWLELVALNDLLEKEDQILTTIEAARESQYPLDSNSGLALAGVSPVAAARDRKKRLDQIGKRCASLEQEIGGSRPEEGAVGTGPQRFKPLTHFNLGALDRAALEGVFGEEYRACDPPLSQAVRMAFGQGKPQRVRTGKTSLLIGASGWAVTLARRAQAAERALRVLQRSRKSLVQTEGPARVAEVLSNLRELQRAAARLDREGEALLQSFLRQIGEKGPLSEALNELLALLTPARWAYEDVVSHADMGGTGQRLRFETRDKVPAQLRLNTAELNTFTLALFLLCARSSANPLRLLVLDDPLQNMDEITVTTVARGLGKVLRLWQQIDDSRAPWRLAILIHGEENLERIRHETPCATYFLPWLSPAPRLEQKHVMRAEPSRMSCELQKLNELIQAVG
jgi:hypothetical protein